MECLSLCKIKQTSIKLVCCIFSAVVGLDDIRSIAALLLVLVNKTLIGRFLDHGVLINFLIVIIEMTHIYDVLQCVCVSYIFRFNSCGGYFLLF